MKCSGSVRKDLPVEWGLNCAVFLLVLSAVFRECRECWELAFWKEFMSTPFPPPQSETSNIYLTLCVCEMWGGGEGRDIRQRLPSHLCLYTSSPLLISYCTGRGNPVFGSQARACDSGLATAPCRRWMWAEPTLLGGGSEACQESQGLGSYGCKLLWIPFLIPLTKPCQGIRTILLSESL